MPNRKAKAKAAPSVSWPSHLQPVHLVNLFSVAKSQAKTAGEITPVDNTNDIDSTNDIDNTNAVDIVQQHDEETPKSPPKILLTDLPLELLFMILDCLIPIDPSYPYTGYPLLRENQTGIRRALVALQHPLLFTCSSLRLSLLSYFYSTSQFYAMIDMRLKGSKSVADVLTLRRLQERLPCNLSTVRVTFRLHHLAYKGLNWSAFTELGLILYEGYQSEKCKSEKKIEIVSPRWQLQCADSIDYYSRPPSNFRLNTDLQALLDGINRQAFAALDSAKDSQAFNTRLEKWLKEDQDTEDPTYRIRNTLRRCMGKSGNGVTIEIRGVYRGL
ncbi:hypothetical protein D6C80_03047 [Aureobasidium pullulans]|nr:hypothetical protein D6C80_03047 [Aureobasidium pullulans]